MIHIVEDDAVVRDALRWLCASRGLEACADGSCGAFLARIGDGETLRREASCLLLDVRMHGMSGTELFEHLRARSICPPASVIFLTGHGDIPMAVEMLKRGALDFFEKPFSDNRLVDRLVEGEALSAERLATPAASEPAVRGSVALEALSAREREVMERILAGMRNKEIAYELGISIRTVEAHRANLFRKLDVDSAVGLARRYAGAGKAA